MTDVLTPEQRLNNLIGLNRYFDEHDAHEYRAILDKITESYDSQIREMREDRTHDVAGAWGDTNERLLDKDKQIRQLTDALWEAKPALLRAADGLGCLADNVEDEDLHFNYTDKQLREYEFAHRADAATLRALAKGASDES